MPRLNTIRLSHIEYNNGHNVITNETLHLDNESSLFRMDNGGGKSVFVQLLLSPYLSKRSRNFPYRPFSDYFRNNHPSLILEEWILDGGGGYFLIGLLVRKKQALLTGKEEELTDQRLDIYSFISEYKNTDDPHSLKALQTIQEEKGIKSYLSFVQIKKQIDQWKKQTPSQVHLYNLNDSSQQQHYFQHLQEFGIEPSEWEQMRTFNLDESGLSDFTTKNNTSEKLISQVFLPAIQRKLDQQAGSNKMGNFRESLASYVKRRLDNEQKYAQIAQHETFVNSLVNLQNLTDLLVSSYRQCREDLQNLDSFQKGLLQGEKELEKRIHQEQENQQKAKDQLNQILIEMKSQQYYSLLDEITTLEQEEQTLKTQRKTIDEQLENLKLLRKRHMLAQNYQEMQKLQRKKMVILTKIEALKKSNEEIDIDLAKLAQGLIRQSEEHLINLQKQLNTLNEEIHTHQSNQEAISVQRTAYEKELSTLDRQIGGCEKILERYQREEKAFLQNWSVPIVHSLSFYEDEELFQNLEHITAQQVKDCQNKENQMQEEMTHLEQSLEKIQEKQVETQREKSQLNYSIQTLQETIQKDQDLLKKKEELCHTLKLDQKKVWDNEFLIQTLEKRISQCTVDIQASIERMNDLNREKRQLETGPNPDLTNEMKEILESQNITLATGIEYLKKRRMSIKAKQNLVTQYPLLPYSFVVESTSLKTLFDLFNEHHPYSSSILSFITPESLRKEPASFELFKEFHFYFRFNPSLLDEEKLKHRFDQIQQLEKKEQEMQNHLNQEQTFYQKKKYFLENHPLLQKEVLKREETLFQWQDKKEKLISKENKLKRDLRDQQKKKKNLEIQKKDALHQTSKAKMIHQATLTLHASYLETVESYHQNESLHQKQQQIIFLRDGLDQEFKRLTSEIQRLTQETLDTQNMLEELQKKQEAYKPYLKVGISETKGTFEELEVKFLSLLSSLKTPEISELRQNFIYYDEQFKKKEAHLKDLLSLYAMQGQDETWKHLKGNEAVLLQLERDIDSLEKKQDTLQQENFYLEKKISIGQNDCQHLLQAIGKIQPNAKPKRRQETRIGDLHFELEATQNDLHDSKKEEIIFRKKVDRLHQLQRDAKYLLDQNTMEPFDTIALEHLVDQSLGELQEKFNTLESSLSHLQKIQKKYTDEIRGNLDKIGEIAKKNRDQDLSNVVIVLKASLENPIEFQISLENRITLFQTMLEASKSDVKHIDEMENQLIQRLGGEYLRNIDSEMREIDKRTTIPLRGRSRKMLTIDLPKWNETLYLGKVRSYVQNLIAEIKRFSQQEDAIERILNKSFHLSSFYNAIIGLRTPKIHILKIEEFQETSIPWENAGKTSGAESFLAAFTIISALLSYQRYDKFDLLSRRDRHSVLIMDNPFAKVHSSHIIEPLWEMCKAQNIQFIAFSAVENAAILEAFNVIYALRLVPRIDMKNHLLVTPIKNSEDHELESRSFHLKVELSDESE